MQVRYYNKYVGSLLFFVSTACSMHSEVRFFHKPIHFSNVGISDFFKYSFNHPRYALDCLAHDFSHLLQFLKHGKKNNNKRVYCKSVMRLFANKIKGSSYVNAHALSECIRQLPGILSDYFMIFKAPDVDPAKKAVFELLYGSFLNSFDAFKQDPDLFLSDLSSNVIDSLNNSFHFNKDATNEEVRKTMLLFLDGCINRLVWNPADGFDTWSMCKSIAQGLSSLHEANIIDDQDDLNDLFVTLIERYCYFLDITDDEFSPEFYEKMRQNIRTESIALLDLEEQEQDIETKVERLSRALFDGETKARARLSGFVI